MAYQEYVGRDGKLRRQHQNGRRLHQPEDRTMALDTTEFHPDSLYYQQSAQWAQEQLRQALGLEAYTRLAEEIWPDAVLDELTWKQISSESYRLLIRVQNWKVTDVDQLVQVIQEKRNA